MLDGGRHQLALSPSRQPDPTGRVPGDQPVLCRRLEQPAQVLMHQPDRRRSQLEASHERLHVTLTDAAERSVAELGPDVSERLGRHDGRRRSPRLPGEVDVGEGVERRPGRPSVDVCAAQ
jgi:hypothetical protein